MSNISPENRNEGIKQESLGRRTFLSGLLAGGAVAMITTNEAGAQTLQTRDAAAKMRDVAANMEREGMAQLLAGMKEAVDNAQSKNPNIPRAQIIASFKRQKPEWPWDKIK